jgi:DNA-directed RNA polymerase specialized sigma24 family protein
MEDGMLNASQAEVRWRGTATHSERDDAKATSGTRASNERSPEAAEQKNLTLTEFRKLRRYVACMVGNVAESDLLIEKALERCVAKAVARGASAVPRAELYREVHRRFLDPRRPDALRRRSCLANNLFLMLPLNERAAILLHAIAELPAADIADILGIGRAALYGIWLAAFHRLVRHQRQGQHVVLLRRKATRAAQPASRT